MTSSATNASPSRTALLIAPRTLRTRTATAAMATTMIVSTTRSTTTVPEDRRPADPLALPERVAPVQLAEPGGQDVVGEVADVRVAEDAPIGEWRDGRQERPPARAAGPDVDGRGDEHHPDPRRRRGAQDLRMPR